MNGEQGLDLVTVSYWRDASRCLLLYESMKKFGEGKIRWFLIVDDQDYQRFVNLIEPGNIEVTFLKTSEIVDQETPERVASGWILQQFVKLLFAKRFGRDYYTVVDSDAFFCNSFSYGTFFQDGKPTFQNTQLKPERQGLLLFKKPIQNDNLDTIFRYWFRKAQELVLDEVREKTRVFVYPAPIITLETRVVRDLIGFIERKYGQEFSKCIMSQKNYFLWFSEYTLYGVFVDCYKRSRGEYRKPGDKFLDLKEPSLDRGLLKDRIAVNVQSNLNLNPAEYCGLIGIEGEKADLIARIYEETRFEYSRIYGQKDIDTVMANHVKAIHREEMGFGKVITAFFARCRRLFGNLNN